MAERECRTRLLLAAEMPVPSLSGLLTVITVPPLRLRPADAVDMQRFFLRRASRLQADGAQLELTKEAERHIQVGGPQAHDARSRWHAGCGEADAPVMWCAHRSMTAGVQAGTHARSNRFHVSRSLLFCNACQMVEEPHTRSFGFTNHQAYGFPGGKTELEASVIKAVSSSRLKASNGNGSPDASMTSPASSTVSVDAQAAAQPALALSRDDFWGVGQVEDRFKIDLLSAMPWLRSFLRSDVWPEGINHGFTKYVFVVMILGLVLGPQVCWGQAEWGDGRVLYPGVVTVGRGLWLSVPCVRQLYLGQWALSASNACWIQSCCELIQHPRLTPPGPRVQRFPQHLLGLVVAWDLLGVPILWPHMVQRLSFHDL